MAAALAWISSTRSMAAEAQPTPADAIESARALSDDGMALFRRAEYQSAIEAFRRSFDLSPAPALLFDMAQAHRKLGNCDAALELFRRFARADQAAALRAGVDARIDEMQSCSTKRQPPVVASLSASVLAAPAAPVLDRVVATRVPEQHAPGRWPRLAGMSLAAVGLVALGAGAFAGLEAQHASRRVSERFRSGGPWTSEDDALVARGQRNQRASWWLYFAGGIAFGGGGALYLWGGPSAGHAGRLTAAPLARGVTLTWTGRL
jgi:tetratricopeptide (TPR) repeat protein